MNSSARSHSNVMATDKVTRFDPRSRRAGGGAGKFIAGAIGLAGVLAISITAIAASKTPVLPLQVPSSVSTPTPEGNPYGLALVPTGFPMGGIIKPGDLLVSNFNNSAAQQGLGTTIDFIDTKNSDTGLYFQVSGLQTTGFTNALGVAKKGFVFAGTVLTTDGTDGTAAPGDLYILDKNAHVVQTIAPMTNLINGPWGLAVNDNGNSAQVFVSNVFDGTVTRLDMSFSGSNVTIKKSTTIASGYLFGLSVGAIVTGPAGLFYNKAKDVLYVAAEDDNEIFAISNASKLTSSGGKGTLIFSNAALNGPLGLVMAPNGHLITVNADSINPTPAIPSDMIEFTTGGTLVRQFSIDPNAGSGFALLSLQNEFAYVDDFTSNVTIWSH
jgi:DNA-binding beta-propeller fold protein YncE